MSADYGPFASVVSIAGSLAAAAGALALTWRGKSKWEPRDVEMPAAYKAVTNVVTMVGVGVLWALYYDVPQSKTRPLLVTTLVAASAAVVGLLAYGWMIGALTYEVPKDKGERVIGGFTQTAETKKLLSTGEVPSVEAALAGADYDADRVWTKASRATAKQTIVAGYLTLTVSGTIGVTAVSMLLGAAHPRSAQRWMLRAQMPAVCSLPALASFDVEYMLTPQAYAEKAGAPLIVNPGGYRVCETERDGWASGNCWYQVATDEHLAVVEMFNGGAEKTKCRLVGVDEWKGRAFPVRSATVESLLYSAGLISGRCAALREPCGGETPCDEARSKAYDELAAHATHLLNAAEAWRTWELDQLDAGVTFEASRKESSEDAKSAARTSRDDMHSKASDLALLIKQAPQLDGATIDIDEKERRRAHNMSSGKYCVPCGSLPSDACNGP